MGVIFAAVLLTWTAAAMGKLEGIRRQEATAALRTALEKGSVAAVARLGRLDGFLGNPQVRIPLPESAQRAERLLRRVGMGKYADELVVTMNPAAESAAPEARALFLDAVKKMSVQDAKGIISGGDTAGTEYFRRTTRDQLHKRFMPIVQRATARRAGAEVRSIRRQGRHRGTAAQRGRRSRRVRHAEGARWPVSAGRGRGKEDPQRPGRHRLQHHPQGLRRAVVATLLGPSCRRRRRRRLRGRRASRARPPIPSARAPWP